MPKPNVTCADCGKPMVSVRPQGTAKCNPCSSVHGTQGRYKRGCRCDLCRAGATERMREYAAARKARTGTSVWADARRRKAEAEGRTFAREVDCALCGESVRCYGESDFAMHRACRNTPDGRALAYRVAHPEPSVLDRFRAEMAKVAEGRPASKRVFVQGPCGWCGESFCAPGGAYCSGRCRMRARESRKRPLEFNPTPMLRRAVYERDGWVCGLCDLPIDRSLAWPHKWSASLDHIVPQSMMLVPDHSAHNLRAVHLQCNAMRGDGSNMSEDELRARAVAEIGGGLDVAC